MQLGKVQSRGQITLPSSVRQSAGLRPGDVLAFKVVGPGKIELRALSRLTLKEALAKWPIEGPVDDAADREEWQDVAARDVISG